MSLLSVNQVIAVLGTEDLAVVNRIKGLQNKIIDQKYQSLNSLQAGQGDESSSVVQPAWRLCTSQFADLLTAMHIKPNAKLSITLASDFVRYLTLPAQSIYMDNIEKQAYAMATYRDVYGDVVSNWEIKLQNSPAHQVTVTAAIDRDLLESLNQIATMHQLKLVAVQPYLMSVVNYLTKKISKLSGYLVVVENSRFTLVNFSHGECVNIRTFPLGSDWQVSLSVVMKRDLLMSDNLDREVIVYAPAHTNIEMKMMEGWKFQKIGTPKNAALLHRHAMLEAAL